MDLNFWQYWPQLAIFGGYVLGAYLVSRLFKWIQKKFIKAFVARSSTMLDDRIVDASSRPGAWVLFLLGLQLGVGYLNSALPMLHDMGWWNPIGILLKGAIVVAVALLIRNIVNASLDWYRQQAAEKTESAWDNEILPLARKFTTLVLLFISASIILKLFDVDITALVTTAGVASLAVAMAAQETLANMIAGFTLMVDRPFRVGDVIELDDGKAGEVLEIGLRATRVQLFDGNALVIPNKDISSSRLTNYALPNERRAVRATISVAYDTDLDKARQVLLEVMHSHPDVLKDPAPNVWLTEFAASSLSLYIACWVSSYKIWFKTKDDLFMLIVRRFREEGITIPFPQVTVHLPDRLVPPQ